jgi:hypothetical protein
MNQSNAVLQSSAGDYAQVLRAEQLRLASERAEANVNLFALLGRHYVVYYPRLAQMVDSPKAALMLGHSLYFTRKMLQSQPERDGWFYMAKDEWFKATGLTKREQATARDVLKSVGLLAEKRLGMPARIWYRLNLEKLAYLLNSDVDREASNLGGENSKWPWEDAALKVLLGRTVIFYAPLAWYLDSAVAAICLSQYINEYRFRVSKLQADKDGFIKTQSDEVWRALEVGISPVRHARRVVEDKQLITFKPENRRGGGLLYRIEAAQLLEAVRTIQFNSITMSMYWLQLPITT